MDIYTAINIGPIISTLSMAKRPRELWSASYLFSHLMRCIIESLPKSALIISPSTNINLEAGVGLYPDRLFVKERLDLTKLIQTIIFRFSKETGLTEETIRNYFNISGIFIEAESEKEAIRKLNNYLDFTELSNRSVDEHSWYAVNCLVHNQYTSPLFSIAFAKDKEQTNKKIKRFNIGTLGEIATQSLRHADEKEWKEARQVEKFEDALSDKIPDEYKIIEEGIFYQKLKKSFPTIFKSYHKYICVVQADGDNMGKIVTHIEDGKVKNLSNKLLDFGKDAVILIKEYGGQPIYAGGDDLLFIAPVNSVIIEGEEKKSNHIFDLLASIDSKYEEVQKCIDTECKPLDDSKQPIHSAMSYGMSITYYKYPLYEALASARDLLFDEAKKIDSKNAIAWKLQKHSGSSFHGGFSKYETNIYDSFKKLLQTKGDDVIISSVAHKLRANEGLLQLWVNKNDKDTCSKKEHISAFFDKFMDIDHKDETSSTYIKSVEDLVSNLYSSIEFKDFITTVYGMLRTAKFINGEEDENE